MEDTYCSWRAAFVNLLNLRLNLTISVGHTGSDCLDLLRSLVAFDPARLLSSVLHQWFHFVGWAGRCPEQADHYSTGWWCGVGPRRIASAWQMPLLISLTWNAISLYLWGGQASSDCLDLLRSLVAFDPSRRPSAASALQHAYFRQSPAPTPPAQLPKPKSRIEAPLKLPPQVSPCPALCSCTNLCSHGGDVQVHESSASDTASSDAQLVQAWSFLLQQNTSHAWGPVHVCNASASPVSSPCLLHRQAFDVIILPVYMYQG